MLNTGPRILGLYAMPAGKEMVTKIKLNIAKKKEQEGKSFRLNRTSLTIETKTKFQTTKTQH
jgi:hypothetical protein